MVRVFRCIDCGEKFEAPFGKPKWMLECPACGSENIVRVAVKVMEEKENERGFWAFHSCCCGGGRFRGGRRAGFGARKRGYCRGGW